MLLRHDTRLADLLDPVYGLSAPAQLDRYAAAMAQFADLYGPGPVQLFRAPGRVNLIGEHTDYNHGFVLPAALDKDIVLLARPRGDATLRAANVEPGYELTEFALSASIPPAAKGHWSNYLRGPAQMVAAQADAPVPGLDLLVVGAPPFGVPRGAGLSSSSAVVVALAVALAHVADLPADGPAFARACADAEWYVGTRGGVMDHFAAILSRQGHALFLDCRPTPTGEYITRHIPFPTDYRLVVVDSGVRHDNVRGEYNLRVAACRAGVALLRRDYPGITHLRDVQDVAWTDLAPLLPDVTSAADLAAEGIELGEIPGLDAQAPLRVAACCRHVWTENQRVLDTLELLRTGDIAAVGAAFRAAHASARDDYAISTPELDFLVETAGDVDGCVGARLTGAGWGGCVVALVAADAVDALADRLQTTYAATYGRSPAVFLCQAAPGAGKLGDLSV